MELEEAVMAYLLSYIGLTALVSTRIFYDELPQGTTLPAVVILNVSDVKAHGLSGQSKLERPNYQFTAYAATKSSAKAVAIQLKAALSDYHGTLSGVVVQKMELQSEFSTLDTTPDGTVRVNTTDLEYEISYLKE